MTKALERLRVLDMSRVLAGPLAAQNLADMGAEVIKIERPGCGDESRFFPPFLKDAQGADTTESGYFLGINRGKRSVTVDLSKPEGQDLVRRLAATCDVLIENYKVGTLRRYGLDYECIRAVNPRIVYCSVTGFGQSGPYRNRPGYDYIFQAMSGLMSVTGERDDKPGGGPAKVGVAISDVITGLYASFAIMAALSYRDITNVGQHIDLSLLNAQIAANSHINMKYLVSGHVPKRMGVAHPSIAPYQVFDCLDGKMVMAVGNDGQFKKLCRIIGRPEWAQDERFAGNVGRVKNRDELVALLGEELKQRPVEAWVECLTSEGVPAGTINNLKQVFEDPHVAHQNMLLKVRHPLAPEVPIVANPIRMSESPPSYDRPPPTLGQHTEEVLGEVLGLSAADITVLRSNGVV